MPAIGIDPAVARARARVAVASRKRDEGAQLEARQDLAAAKIEDYIRRTVDAAPPLTSDQRNRLALLLRGGDAA